MHEVNLSSCAALATFAAAAAATVDRPAGPLIEVASGGDGEERPSQTASRVRPDGAVGDRRTRLPVARSYRRSGDGVEARWMPAVKWSDAHLSERH